MAKGKSQNITVMIVRNEETNKPVGLKFPSISRGLARTSRPRTTSVPTDNTTDVIFEQIYLFSDNIIKNVYFTICVILNTFTKKTLKQQAAQMLYRNNYPSDL